MIGSLVCHHKIEHKMKNKHDGHVTNEENDLMLHEIESVSATLTSLLMGSNREMAGLRGFRHEVNNLNIHEHAAARISKSCHYRQKPSLHSI